jgi:hypothetical protein
MTDSRKAAGSTEFDPDDFVRRMIPILASRNQEIGSQQLVDIMAYPELCDLAWMKLLRHPERLTGDLLCQVVKRHERHRVEAAALVLLKDPTTEQLCCVHTFVPEYAGVAKTMLADLGCKLP